MIKSIMFLFVFLLVIGCKSPVSDLPTATIPPSSGSDHDSSLDDTQDPMPDIDIPEVEVPFIPPNGYIGEGGETDTSIIAIDEDVYVAFSDVNKNMEMQGYKENEWVAQDVSSVRVNATAKNPIDMIHIDNIPYVAFSDANATGRLRLKKLDGSSWVDVGEKYLSTETVSSISMVAINKDLYIAHKGVTGGGTGVIVRKFNTTTSTLETLPSPYNYEASYIQLVILNGGLHLIFRNRNSTGTTYVYNDALEKWSPLGVGGTATGGIHTSWFDGVLKGAVINSTLHVIYQSNNNPLLLVKYENDAWSEVSTVSDKQTSVLDFIAIDGVPYVVYTDPGYGDRLLVRYLGSDGSWKDVDTDKVFLSSAKVAYVDMSYDNGILYVAFQDLSEEGGGRIKVLSFEL